MRAGPRRRSRSGSIRHTRSRIPAAASRWEAGRSQAVRGERRAVEVADEVLGARAAGDPTRVEADEHDPLDVVRIAVDRQGEEVRALPDAADGVARAELGEPGPLLEVGRRPEIRTLCSSGDHRHHPPLVRRRVPEHLRVTELARADVDDRVARVLGPGLTVVGGVRQRLGLNALTAAGCV